MFEKFKKFMGKFNSGYFYILDKETFIYYLNEQVNFASENDLEAVENLNICSASKKYNLSIWDFTKANTKEEKGFSVMFNNQEYHSINNLFQTAYLEDTLLDKIDYFKIELVNGDSVFLNKYKEEHPELTEDILK